MIGEIRKFKFWCQKVLPLVYDDSLSYYEVLCKLVTYLNNIIEDVNSIPDYIDNVIDERLSDEKLKELIAAVVANIESAISSNNEGDNTNSSTDYNIGQMLWWKDKLYKVIRQIDAGDTFIVDTNIELVDFETLFNNFVDEVKHDISANDDGSNSTASQNWTAGTWLWLNDVLYVVKSDITQGNAYVFSGANANVEQITIEDVIGNLENLQTDEKTNIVSAINDIDNIIKGTYYINVLNPPDELEALDNTGATDNTSKLQNIVNYIAGFVFPPHLGACIFFPEGTYLINGTVNVNKSHIRFLGAENGATRFHVATTNAAGLDMFYITANFITFEHICFWCYGDSTYKNTFIHSYGARRVIMDNCMLYDASNAIVIENTPGCRFQNVWVSFDNITYSSPIAWHFKGLNNSSYLLNCVGNCRPSTTGTCLKLEGHPSDVYIEHFESAGGADSVEVTADSGITVHDLQFIDCVLDEPSTRGFYIHDLTEDSEVSILGGFISPRSNGGRCFRLENCYNIMINNVKMMNNHNLTNIDGISIATSVKNVIVKNCYFYDMIRSVLAITAATQLYANISIDDNMIVNKNHTGGTIMIYSCKTGSVSNNAFQGNITQAIAIPSNSNNVMCIGNHGLTDDTCTNNYLGAYSATGFTPDITNTFVVA